MAGTQELGSLYFPEVEVKNAQVIMLADII
jgi:hypothetical protein